MKSQICSILASEYWSCACRPSLLCIYEIKTAASTIAPIVWIRVWGVKTNRHTDMQAFEIYSWKNVTSQNISSHNRNPRYPQPAHPNGRQRITIKLVERGIWEGRGLCFRTVTGLFLCSTSIALKALFNQYSKCNLSSKDTQHCSHTSSKKVKWSGGLAWFFRWI